MEEDAHAHTCSSAACRACLQVHPPSQAKFELDGEDSEWVDATRNPQLLDYSALQTLGFDFEGTTDVLVAERSAVRAHQPEKGARVLFDIRMTITGSEIVDAEARLVLANLHAPNEKPIMVRSANSPRAPKSAVATDHGAQHRRGPPGVLVLAGACSAPPPMGIQDLSAPCLLSKL